MQDLINHCLQYNPNDRPTAQQVFDRLCTTEFVSLKRTIQVECDQDTESLFTTRVSYTNVLRIIIDLYVLKCLLSRIANYYVLCSGLQFSRQDGVKHIEVWIVSAVGSQGLVC